ncbi:uncharacterized protein TRIADDRAFT_52547 [Trichoplax adhaerens]|uniref:N-acetyltransferase domain-containing protein n=1 Tax=Trichoplax adhaerens TaxID=10228 RepID=B3RJ27_TRIAD|nr:hypothetical protein TRIADDRAFT_52547 [Trichoplax adhaerens]EDV29047.1 hypothetical protein TRIADDRAFT_52547 [Trichoplax adhaerens]|eukprot:XP_002108249.1 hypothetical protein TRIADDRAFT_52547 [Trichoplax adhaerens]
MQKSMEILEVKERDQIKTCFNAFKELRPHLKDSTSFVDQVIEQQKQGYTIAAIFDNSESSSAAACIGYREITTLAWGRCIYIDDFTTHSVHRRKGYGNALLKYVIDIAKRNGYDMIHLDTGYGRHDAHRVYLRNDFQFKSHHLSLTCE